VSEREAMAPLLAKIIDRTIFLLTEDPAMIMRHCESPIDLTRHLALRPSRVVL